MHYSALIGMLALSTATSALTIPGIAAFGGLGGLPGIPWIPGIPPFPGFPGSGPGSQASIRNLKDKIKNVVLLCMENRSVDNLLGGQTQKGIENSVNNGPFCNPFNISDPSQGQWCSQPKDYDSVTNDPSHAVNGNNMEFFGTWNPDNNAIAKGKLTPSNKGFLTEHIYNYGSKTNHTELAIQVMNYYTESQVPVMTSFVQNFQFFNHWHSDLAGPTDPNRMYLTSGTSAGRGKNSNDDYTYELTQKSIFEILGEKGISWLNYWDTAGGTGPEAKAYKWTQTSGNEDKVVNITQFYSDAAAGKLPQFSYLNPSCCGVGTTSMHDAGLISDGEAFLKKVYEALRNGPQWENTLFILTFDESGGFTDRVPAPLAPAPDDDVYVELTPAKQNYTMTFNRLGGRIPTFLISPWVSKGGVEQFGKNAYGQEISYSATSILRTLGYLWDFDPFNARVRWAASFDHLIQYTPQWNPIKTLPTPNHFSDYKRI